MSEAVELRHRPPCSQGLMVGRDCICEPEVWVRLQDVVEALREPTPLNRGLDRDGAADFIEREFGAHHDQRGTG